MVHRAFELTVLSKHSSTLMDKTPTHALSYSTLY